MHLPRPPFALLIVCAILWPSLLKAQEEDHHTNAEARLDVLVSDHGTVESIRHLWRMDADFTNTLIDEFDENANGVLDAPELDQIGPVIRESIAAYDNFQMVTRNGTDVAMVPPAQLIADLQDGQLIILFESRPSMPLPLDGKLAFGVYDPTFHTIFNVADDSYMTVSPKPSNCTEKVVRPDADAAMKRHAGEVARALSGDSVETGLIKVFATRLELDCSPPER